MAEFEDAEVELVTKFRECAFLPHGLNVYLQHNVAMLGSEVEFLEQSMKTGITVCHRCGDTLQGVCVLLVHSTTQFLVDPVKGSVVPSLATILLLEEPVSCLEFGIAYLVVIQAGRQDSLEFGIFRRECGVCEPSLQHSTTFIVATKGDGDSFVPSIEYLKSHGWIVEQLGAVSSIDPDNGRAVSRWRHRTHIHHIICIYKCV